MINLKSRFSGLNKIDKEIWGEILKFSIEHYFSVQISFNDCSKIISLLSNQIGKRVNISNGLAALRERDNILIYLQKKQENLYNEELIIGDKAKI